MLTRSDTQRAHDDQNLYRLGAGITCFKIRDPDPNAVDNGRILGLRFDAVANARFLRPYYVMLNKPYPASPHHLRVHRHTVPPCIPLPGLAARYLPSPRQGASSADDGNGSAANEEAGLRSREGAKQDLSRFARELRREIVRYHNRAGAVAGLSEAAAAAYRDDEEGQNVPLDVRAADAQMKQIELAWADGRTGRLIMDDDGMVERAVVYRGESQDYETKRQLVGECERIEQVVKLMRSRGGSEAEGG